MNCPHCKSSDYKKAGFLKSGAQRYKCRSCGKLFSSKTIIREKVNETCPKCSSTDIIRHGKINGKQKYMCNSCGITFVEKDKKTYYSYECPRCKNNKVLLKENYRANGKGKYYYCPSCKHKFLIGGKNILTESQKKEIIEKYKNGALIKDLAQEYDRVCSTISSLVKGSCSEQEYLENACKAIPEQKRRDLVYFGIGAKVREEYLSTYLKVDRKVVHFFLSKYKEKMRDK